MVINVISVPLSFLFHHCSPCFYHPGFDIQLQPMGAFFSGGLAMMVVFAA